MANSQCLRGMRCPTCGSVEPFRIEVMTTVVVWDAETEPLDPRATPTWDASSYCKCMQCDMEGLVCDFRIENT